VDVSPDLLNAKVMFSIMSETTDPAASGRRLGSVR
jgi:ribosome-binding factor A